MILNSDAPIANNFLHFSACTLLYFQNENSEFFEICTQKPEIRKLSSICQNSLCCTLCGWITQTPVDQQGKSMPVQLVMSAFYCLKMHVI